MLSRISMLAALAALAIVPLGACSPSTISSPWAGHTKDLLQKSSDVTVTSSGDKSIKVSITIDGSSNVCEGEFEMISSRSGIPLFSGALKSYKGSFKQAGADCQKAIGSPGNVSQFLDIRDSSLPFLFDPMLQVCNTDSSELLCLAANTFSIGKKKS